MRKVIWLSDDQIYNSYLNYIGLPSCGKTFSILYIIYMFLEALKMWYFWLVLFGYKTHQKFSSVLPEHFMNMISNFYLPKWKLKRTQIPCWHRYRINDFQDFKELSRICRNSNSRSLEDSLKIKIKFCISRFWKMYTFHISLTLKIL